VGRVAAVVAALVFFGAETVPAMADPHTVAQDVARTAWDSDEPALTRPAVASGSFGQLFSAPVDGQVYAQPLVVDDTVIAVTETNDVYGIDGETGAVRWHRNVGPWWDPATLQCADLTPSIGITSTPVYDPVTDSVYLTAKTNDGPDARSPNWYAHALDAATGTERQGWPIRISGTPSNDPDHPFNSLTAAQRPGLLLLDGVVYAGFASYCDWGPYVGYVVGVSTSGRQTTMWSTESGSSSGGAGIWQSGAGLVSDGPGQILFATGNGISPPPGPGKRPPATLGESIVRLQVGADGNLTATDFFSPANNAELADVDLGSGGPMAIPDGYGTFAHPHLLVHVGKDGRVFVLDRDDLGGMGQGPGGTDALLAQAGPYEGVWGRSAFLGTNSSGYFYNVGAGAPLRAFRMDPTDSGGIDVPAVGASAGTFPYASGSPVVTSNGKDASTALVWVVRSNGGGSGTGAELLAYRAQPDAEGVLQQVFSAPIGTAVKFTSVATSNGRVYVGTRDGHVLGFGAPTKAALAAASTTTAGTMSARLPERRVVQVSGRPFPPLRGV
jgi:outer membrane protein assembly factor BamB